MEWLAYVLVAAGLATAIYFVVARPQQTVTANPVLDRLERYIDRQTTTYEKPPGPINQVLGTIRRFLAERETRTESDSAYQLAQTDLEKADLPIQPLEWMVLRIAVGVFLFLIITLEMNVVFGLVAGVGVGFLGGRFFLAFRQRRRQRKFEGQLSETSIALANSLRAGYSFAQALAAIGENGRPPVSLEFERATKAIQLGLPMEDALRQMVERNSSDDLDLLVTAVNIHRVVGGNLAEIFDKIGETIRERIRIKGEIHTLTAQARVSGWIIALLPIGLAAILSLIAPDYFDPMLGSLVGYVMLTIGAISMGVGILLIRKIVNIKI